MKTPPPPADTFIQTFQQDLTNRLHRKKVIHYASGPTLTLEASLLQYDCESRSPSYQQDLLTNKGTLAIESVLTDESGRRIGGGKATMAGAGFSPENAMKETQKKLVAAIGDYLKKSARGNEPDPPGSDDP